MKLNKKKFERQKEIVDKWEKNNYLGTCEAVTRFGKTFVGIIAAKRLLREKSNPVIVACVPTDYLRDKWKEELKKFDISGYVDTVHNLVKMDIDADLLILDELHLFVGEYAEVFPTVFQAVRADRIFGLTATLGKEGINMDLVNEYCPVIDTVSMEEALREGYISDYIQYNYGIILSEKDQRIYNALNKKFYKYFSTFEYDFDLVRACLDKQRAEERALEINYEPEIVYIHAIQFMRMMRERKEFLYSVDSKTQVAKDIILKFPQKKVITFAQTTDTADKLASMLEGAESYHSNLNTIVLDEHGNKVGEKVAKDKYQIYRDKTYTWKQLKTAYPNVTRKGQKTRRTEILNGYINGDFRILCTAKALDVGLDFDDIDLSIILSGTSKFRQNVQRVGRALNKAKDKIAIIIQLYVRGTQDEKWLNKRQNNMGDIIDISHISQIKT